MTCKDRLHHVKQTLPLLLEQGPDEVVLVDYGCPQHAGKWVEAHHPQVKVVYVTDDPGFCLARARNIGAHHTEADWLCFIDADIRIRPGLLRWLRAKIEPWFYYRAAAESGILDKDVWGTVVCARKAFDMVQGYDEVMRGWGGEDDDFYERLKLLGLAEGAFPPGFLAPIPHDDGERVKYSGSHDKDGSSLMNSFYLQAKLIIMWMQGRRTPLSLGVRESLMQAIRDAMRDWRDDPAQPLPSITFATDGIGWMPSRYVLDKRGSFTLTLRDLSMARNERTAASAACERDMSGTRNSTQGEGVR